MLKVLVVEDSPVVQEFLIYLLSSDPQIEVVGKANDGEQAIEAVERLKPDVITMDIHMPKMNGFDATRKIMANCPTPIVIVSGSMDTKEVAITFQAIEAGALTAIPRPLGIGHPRHEASATEFLQTVKLMSEVKVVRRWNRLPRDKPKENEMKDIAKPPQGIRLVAIGASTGGPMALQNVLSRLPQNFPVPILIVQHMSPGFVHGFTQWLGTATGFPVRVAENGISLLPGHAYVAPDQFHLTAKAENLITLTQDEPVDGLRPAVAYLFESVAKVYGPNAIGVLLTGMGKDGALKLKQMKDAGAITIAQDEESSVVYGMPGEAVKIGAAMHVLPPEAIAALLKKLINRKEG